MNKINLTSITLLLFCTCFLISCSSNYKVEKAGTLRNIIKEDIYKISSLTLSGSINRTDFSTMSEMCSFGNLQAIDLTDCKIVADGEDGANTIPTEAFNNAKGLVSIKLPTNTKKISSNSFSNCRELANIYIPKTITIIDSEAFSGCESLKLQELHYGLIKIGDGAFSKCKNIALDIPKTVSDIGEDAFMGCNNLTSISIPDNITEIKEGTFALCTNLTSITFPKRLYSIGKQSFSGCQNLKNIKLSENIVYIGDYAFDSCFQLETVVLSNNLKTIGNSAFAKCKSLKDINFPESLERIDYRAFEDCTSLKNVIISNKTLVTQNAFDNCPISAKDTPKIEKQRNNNQINNSPIFNLLGAWSIELEKSYLTVIFKNNNIIEAKSKGKSDYYVNTQLGNYSINSNIININTEDNEKITLHVKDNALYVGNTKFIKGDLVGDGSFAPAGTGFERKANDLEARVDSEQSSNMAKNNPSSHYLQFHTAESVIAYLNFKTFVSGNMRLTSQSGIMYINGQPMTGAIKVISFKGTKAAIKGWSPLANGNMTFVIDTKDGSLRDMNSNDTYYLKK